MKVVRAKDLGIDIASGTERELVKWLFAALLFGKPVQQKVAARTYQAFEQAGMLSLEKMANAKWDRLVELLDEGHYVRYDFSTADKLLEVSKTLLTRYGSVTNLVSQSGDRNGLMKRLQEFKGIGPVTARIFARDAAPLLRAPARRARAKT